MREFLTESALFGVVLSLAAFQIGVFVRKKTGISFLTPLVTAMAIIIVFLVVTDIDYEAYNEGASILMYFLTPATVCLAVPLYQKMKILKENLAAVLIGIISGVMVSALCILGLSILFNLY